MDMSVKVKCRHCGRLGDAQGFKLDPFFKAVVCAACISDRKAKDITTQGPSRPIETRPRGFPNPATQRGPGSPVRNPPAPSVSRIEAAPEKSQPKPAGWDEDDEQ